MSSLPLGSPEYLSALTSLTRSVTARGAGAGWNRPNDSNLHQVRTDDLELGQERQMREFRIPTHHDGGLEHFYLKQTPAISLNQTDRLASYINENQSAILADHYELPQEFPASRDSNKDQSNCPNLEPFGFRGGTVAVRDTDSFWHSQAIVSARARFHFSVNTCNGCHGRETGTTRQGNPFHVHPRSAGVESQISHFMDGSGAPVTDPVDPTITRNFNDLARRRIDILNYFCGRK